LKNLGFTLFKYTVGLLVYIQAKIQQTLPRQALSSMHWHAIGTEYNVFYCRLGGHWPKVHMSSGVITVFNEGGKT